MIRRKSLPLGVPPLGECPKDKGGAASGEEKVSTNGRRMRGQPLLLMQVSVRLYVYRGLRKSRKLFVKMISRTSQPLIRFCSQVCSQNLLPPEGKAFCFTED